MASKTSQVGRGLVGYAVVAYNPASAALSPARGSYTAQLGFTEFGFGQIGGNTASTSGSGHVSYTAQLGFAEFGYAQIGGSAPINRMVEGSWTVTSKQSVAWTGTAGATGSFTVASKPSVTWSFLSFTVAPEPSVTWEASESDAPAYGRFTVATVPKVWWSATVTAAANAFTISAMPEVRWELSPGVVSTACLSGTGVPPEINPDEEELNYVF